MHNAARVEKQNHVKLLYEIFQVKPLNIYYKSRFIGTQGTLIMARTQRYHFIIMRQ